MKRKRTECTDSFVRMWRTLRKAVGEDPEDLGIQADPQIFNAFFLASSAEVKESSYTPRVYEHFAGVPYFRPDGWWQFRVPPWCLVNGASASGDKAALDFEEIESWPVGYHGTSCDKLKPILNDGLRKPGETPLAVIAHGSLGAGAQGSVYLSPSLWYASHPVYSTLKKIGKDRWVQAVLKLRARPTSYRIQAGSLGNKHWRQDLKIDPNFRGIHGLEWLFDRSALTRCDYVIVGVMLRELGARAHTETFGVCPALSDNGPEYEWTGFLRRRFEKGGFAIEDTESATYMDPSPTHDIGTDDTTSDTTTEIVADQTECCTCNCTEDDCDLDHGRGLRDAQGVYIRETAMRPASKLDVEGALHAEHRLSLGAAAALASDEWSKDTMKALASQMKVRVMDCLVRGQGIRADLDAKQNYKEVLKRIRKHSENFSDPLEVDDILEWHGLCMKSIDSEAGQLRTTNVKCGEFPRLDAFKVPHAINDFVDSANTVSNRHDLSGPAKAAWCFHHLCRIHPFRDGNGRISRLIAIWALARHGLPWAFSLVPLFTDGGATARAYYIDAIRQAHKGVGREGADTRPLVSHICRCLLESLNACGGFPPRWCHTADDFCLDSHQGDPLVDDHDTETL